MNLNFISDIHIKEQSDEHGILLMNFLEHCRSDEVTEIFLLGDIFDLLVGNHSEYIEQYGNIFDRLKSLLKSGKKIWFFEGNHDMHLSKLFRKEFKEYWNTSFFLCKDSIELERFNKKLYLTHGDYLTDHEPGYKRYRRFASWRIMELIFEDFIPYWFISLAGGGYSKKSKKDKTKSFDLTDTQAGFRLGARRVYDQYKPDYLIAGHSHIKEEIEFEKGKYFLNNGFAPKEKTYLQITENGHEFKLI